MGWKNVREALEFLKTRFPGAFSIKQSDEEFVNELKNKNCEYHVSFDLLLSITVHLSVLSSRVGNIKGITLFNRLMNEIKPYIQLNPASIHLAFDGSINDRPKPKDLSKRRKNDDLIVDPSNVIFNDNNFPHFNIWINNKSNDEFKLKGYHYFCVKFVEYWLTNKITCTLVIDNGTTKGGKFCRIKIKNGIVYTKEGEMCNIGEGENVMFAYFLNILKSYDKKKKNYKFIVFSHDSDCIDYANLLQLRSKLIRSLKTKFEIIIRSKISGKQKKNGKFFAINIKILRRLIKREYSDITDKMSKVDWPTIIIILLGMMRGNDFIPKLGSVDGLSDNFDPSLTKMNFRNKAIFESCINYIKRRSLALFECYIINKWELVWRIYEQPLIHIIQKRRTFTKKRKLKVLATFKNIKWCLNYMSNPGQLKYVNNYKDTRNAKSVYGYCLKEDEKKKCFQTIKI
jgi:hypothetical protein